MLIVVSELPWLGRWQETPRINPLESWRRILIIIIITTIMIVSQHLGKGSWLEGRGCSGVSLIMPNCPSPTSTSRYVFLGAWFRCAIPEASVHATKKKQLLSHKIWWCLFGLLPWPAEPAWPFDESQAEADIPCPDSGAGSRKIVPTSKQLGHLIWNSSPKPSQCSHHSPTTPT